MVALSLKTQSNGLFWLSAGGLFTGDTGRTTALRCMKNIIDPTEAEVVFENQPGWVEIITGTSTAGTMATGSSTLTDWLTHDSNPANYASWPLTTIGNLYSTYHSGLSAGDKAKIVGIVCAHNEYDSDTTRNTGTLSVPLIAAGFRRFIEIARTGIGKTAAQCPAFGVGPLPFAPGAAQPSRDQGMDAIRQAYRQLAGEVGLNFHHIDQSWWGTEWDLDAPGAYGSHGDGDDHRLVTSYMARGLARVLGPILAPSGYGNRRYSALGPQIVWTEYVNGTTLDAWVHHDGGTTLALGANANTTAALNQWQVKANGIDIVPTAVAIPATGPGAGRRVRLTMPAMPPAQAVGLQFNYGNKGVSSRAGAVVDNSDTHQSALNLVLPTALTGSDRVPMPIRPMLDRMRARIGPPPGGY
jgi:hypothetical protein